VALSSAGADAGDRRLPRARMIAAVMEAERGHGVGTALIHALVAKSGRRAHPQPGSSSLHDSIGRWPHLHLLVRDLYG